MSAVNYHIHQSPNKTLEYFLVAIAVVAFLIRPIKRAFRVSTWKTGFIDKANKDIKKIYIASERLKFAVEKFDNETAKSEYASMQKILNRYRKFYALLEKAQFLNNSYTQELSENTLLNLYAVESKVRNLAFSSDIKNPEDHSLNEFASQLSLGSLQA